MTPSPVATLTRMATTIMTPVSTATPTATVIETQTATATITMTPTPTATPTPVGAFALAPMHLNFGKVKVGRTSPVKFVNVVNPPKNKGAATINGVGLRSQMMGSSSGFTIEGSMSTCAMGTVLARGKRCRIALTFTPPAVGIESDNLMITGNVTNSGQPIELLGIGK